MMQDFHSLKTMTFNCVAYIAPLHFCVMALAKSHHVGFRKLPGLRNSLPTSKTKTLGEIWKISRSWLHFVFPIQHELLPLIEITLRSLTYNVFTFFRIFYPERAWSGFGQPDTIDFSPGDKY